MCVSVCVCVRVCLCVCMRTRMLPYAGVCLGNDSHLFSSQHCSDSFVMIWHGSQLLSLKHTYAHTTCALDVNECATNNGGCDSKRTCINTVGSMSCGDCPAGYTNNGPKGCQGLRVRSYVRACAFACVCVCVRAFVRARARCRIGIWCVLV